MKRTVSASLVRWLMFGTLAAAGLALTACAPAAPQAAWHTPTAAVGGSGGGDEVVDTEEIAPNMSAMADAEGVLKTTGGTSVALTFDDGPSAYTPQLLALLRQHRVKATFCLVGINVKSNHDMVRAIVADGHTLCNHTWKHDLSLGKKSPDTIRADLQRTLDEIHLAVPDAPVKYFRHPGGNFTPAAVSIAGELGMVSAGWEVDTRDWEISRYPVGPTMTNHVINCVRRYTKPGSIVLAHDSGGDRSSTIAAFRTLLPELNAKYTLAPLPN